jgi:acetyltransferase-like isoleucine patch superfamily enzyme
MKLVRYLYYLVVYIIARLISVLIYDKKYLESKYFRCDKSVIFALGWKWVIQDFMGRVILGKNRGIPFPVSPRIMIGNPMNIIFHPDDLNNFQGMGNYYQTYSNNKIIIGKGSWIAPNVGLITSNHNVYDLENHDIGKDITIGDECWIGMNSVILPGVTLGPKTTVGACSIVTKSFPDGNCVIAGNPAKLIRNL